VPTNARLNVGQSTQSWSQVSSWWYHAVCETTLTLQEPVFLCVPYEWASRYSFLPPAFVMSTLQTPKFLKAPSIQTKEEKGISPIWLLGIVVIQVYLG
jgi:hypothetical protein